MIKSNQLLNKIAQAIFDKKGVNIYGIDLHQISDLVDYCLIAEGNVERHVMALTQEIKKRLKDEDNVSPIYCEGEKQGDWVVLDFGDVVVHLMTPDMRRKYALEDLWKQASIVDLDIKVQDETARKCS